MLTLALLIAGLLLVAGVHLLALVAALGLRKRWIARGRRGADEAVALILISGAWPLIYLVEILVPAEHKLILSAFEAACASLVPFAWGALLLALDGKAPPRFRVAWPAAALIVASVVFTAAVTQDVHGLYWGSTRIINHQGFTLLATTKGPLASALMGFYLVALLALVLLAWRTRRGVPGLELPTASLLILAALAPFLATAVDDAGLRPLQGLDLEPYAVLFPGLVLLLLMQVLYRWDLTQQARNLLFDAAPDGIIILTLDGRVWDMNRAASTLLGIADGPGARLSEVWPEVPSLGDGFADWSRDGRTLEVIAFSVTEEGNKVGTALVLRDVTESRAAATRAALADRLGHMGIVTTGLAHEINNPLAVVMVGIEHAMQVIEKAPGTDMARMALTDAHQAAGQLRAVARSLRDFAHLDDEPVRSIVVTEAIERSLTVMGRALTAHARIERLFEPVAPVRMPPGRLEQVLVALLRNASQALAGRPGPERLILRVLQDPGEVVIEVEDSGPGMTHDVLERAFEPFFTTRGHGGGTGLGLYVARALVERYGGRLTLDSGPGRGTRARIRLPVSTEVPSPTPPTPATGEHTPSPALARRRILIVDDDPRVGKALARLLHEHDVTVAHDGEQAVQAMARQRYDLVLCDVMMPKMSGIEVYETAVDVDPALGDTFVFITGGTFTPEATAFLDRFPGRVLEKPIASAALRDAIRRARTRP